MVETEFTVYCKIGDPSKLNRANSVEEHFQAEMKLQQGRCRVRKTKVNDQVKYEMTLKILQSLMVNLLEVMKNTLFLSQKSSLMPLNSLVQRTRIRLGISLLTERLSSLRITKRRWLRYLNSVMKLMYLQEVITNRVSGVR